MPSCVCAYVSACAHSLSVGDVGALKQKPSQGFCLAGCFMKLSVPRKGKGLSELTLACEKPTFLNIPLLSPYNIYTIKSLNCSNVQPPLFISQVKMRGHHTLPLEARYLDTFSIFS